MWLMCLLAQKILPGGGGHITMQAACAKLSSSGAVKLQETNSFSQQNNEGP